MMAPLLAAAARVISGASVRWSTDLPDSGQRVFFANHTSHLDFVVLWSALPKPLRELARPVAAREYWERGALRRYLATRVFHAVLVDRGGASASSGHEKAEAARHKIERLAAEMGDRYSLIVFPEGTRGSGHEVAAFKSGLYHLCCVRPALELIPVYLDNMNRILPKGETLPVPMLSRVVFGAPMRLSPGESKAEFLERAHAAVCALRAR